MRISTNIRLASSAPLTALLLFGAHCSSKGSLFSEVAAVDASGDTGGLVQAPSTADGGTAIFPTEAGVAIDDSGAQHAAVMKSGDDGGVVPATDATGPGSAAEPAMPDSGLPDAGGEGDGDRTIGPTYAQSPLLTPGTGPKGMLVNFTMQGSDSQIYKGINGNYMRPVTVYIPAQYVPGTPAPLIVSQDAMGVGQLNVVLDNLIAMKMLPAIVVFFVSNGGGDAQGSERGLEYDTVSGLFAEFIDTEVLPRGIQEVKAQLNIELAITDDPNGRGTFGGSSGGAASFSMAWWHPDMFRRVLTYSGTYVSQVPDGSPFPHGCWAYHDVDPHFTSMTDPPAGLIVQHCEPTSGFVGSSNPGPCDTPLSLMACESVTGCVWNDSVNRPIRAWIESADGDLGTPGHLLDVKYGPVAYRDFDIANQRMAQAFALRGYQYHYDHALDAGHVDPNVVGQTLPEALLWVWRGYPVN